MISPNVPEICRTWACMRAKWHPPTTREWRLFGGFLVACLIVILWPEPNR